MKSARAALPCQRAEKPGQSENSKGRPKGARNLATIFYEALHQKLEIRERGRLRQVSALEAMVKKLINEALKGNIKAIEFLLVKAEPVERITPDMDANEAANVYLRMVRRIRPAVPPPKATSP
jgi:hypothetical protein